MSIFFIIFNNFLSKKLKCSFLFQIHFFENTQFCVTAHDHGGIPAVLTSEHVCQPRCHYSSTDMTTIGRTKYGYTFRCNTQYYHPQSSITELKWALPWQHTSKFRDACRIFTHLVQSRFFFTQKTTLTQCFFLFFNLKEKKKYFFSSRQFLSFVCLRGRP